MNTPDTSSKEVIIFNLEQELNADTYIKFNPNTGETYEFNYDLETDLGAKLLDTNDNGLIDKVEIHLQDGEKGDVDGELNGFIYDPGLLATSGTNPTNPTPDPETLLDDPFYRFQNTNQAGTYLFAGEIEAESIRNNFIPPFVEEGLAFNVSFESTDDLVRFNRFQSNFLPGTYIFASEGESESIRANFSDAFTEEGIAFYAYGADDNQGQDVIRFRNQNNNTYLFVLGDEAQNIEQNFSDTFTREGVAFEVIT